LIDQLSGLPGLPIEELNSILEEQYITCDCHTVPDLADDELQQLILAMLEQVWKDKGMPAGLINKEVTTAIAERLWSAVLEGYGADFSTLDWDTPDYRMLEALEQNIWHFSAAKNYTHLRQLSGALLAPDGKLRTKAQFFEEAFKINKTQVRSHLATERELAIAGSQMASKWVDIQADQETFPYVEFDVVMDGRTTELCTSLNGVIVPIGHPYLKTYYPPNHFNCRTTVRKRRNGKVTENLPYPEIPDMFRTNLGEQGLIFPINHAYFDGLPSEVTDKADKWKPNREGNG
jgi:hypothetical protein